MCEGEEDKIYYRWGLSEYQYGGDTHFNGISEFLRETDQAFHFRDDLIKIMAKAVNETEDELFGQFGQRKENIVFFVSMTDDDSAEELENQSVVQMTEAKRAAEFMRRYE